MGNIWDIVAGLISSALAAMGVGGGGLLVICLVLLENVPQLTAQGINLVFFVVCAGTSMLIHLRRRRIDRFLLWGILPGCLGAFFGSRMTALVPVETIRLWFGVLLCISGGVGLVSAFFGKRDEKKQTGSRNMSDLRKKR